MRPQRLLAAGVVAGLAIVLAGLSVVTTLHIGDASRGTVHAVSGQVIDVVLTFIGADILSSDEAVVKPLGTASGPPRSHFFVAGVPGKAMLRPAALCNRETRCLAEAILWHVEVDVD